LPDTGKLFAVSLAGRSGDLAAYLETTMYDRLNNYLIHCNQVYGWLNKYSAKFIADLSHLQRENNIFGALGEIGVHMGRLFIILKLTAKGGERCFAIDIFDRQDLNVDDSGRGDRAAFLRNLSVWTGDDDVSIIQSASVEVAPDDIIKAVGRCRLVSIDGGHTEDCTHSDLLLIEAVLIDRGAVVIDDFFNQMWPGVAAGAARYFLDRATGLRPFAITPNKVYLARPTWHEFYRNGVRRSHAARFEKTVRVFGHEVDIFGCEHATPTWQSGDAM
jgi:hypothetical protein